MNKYKVSIVIPVYNSENYIRESIESIQRQSLKEIEIILVNDGSTDNSPFIIEDYQKHDSRITVINQENKGVSVARNRGVSIAKGEYIGFVDSDDYVDLEMFKTLYNEMINEKLEIVISNFRVEQNGEIITNRPIFSENIIYSKKFIQEHIIPYFIEEDGLNSCVNKLYKKEILFDNKIQFPVGVTNGEDGLFNLQCFNIAKKVKFINYSGYHYREVLGSATRNIEEKDYFKLAKEVYLYDYKSIFNLSLNDKKINNFKKNRFINTIISIVSIYLGANKNISFYKRYIYVKKMINSPEVILAVNNTSKEFLKNNKYKTFLFNCIKNKSMFKLLLATSYSNFRNK